MLGLELKSRRVLWVLVGIAASFLPLTADAQVIQQSIGGVLIDADGMLRQTTLAERRAQFDQLRRDVRQAPDDLATPNELRKISLRKLDEQLQEVIQNGGQMSDELRYLGGLQRVEYVMVFPAEQDIVLVGPGEGWTVSATGEIVGAKTGLPVVLLEDLLVALRSTEGARTAGISCSIDPTTEGRQALNAYLSKQKQFHRGIVEAVKEVMGPQQITLSGVSEQSHFAQVLVAADYRMKRLAMHLDASPIDDMPSFLELAQKRRGALTSMMPRWWLACDYQPLLRSEDGLSWQLRGTGVKAMTEDQMIHEDGSVEQTGKTNPVAQEWATRMTRNYDELTTIEPVFGQLRNLMDLCVIAALIEKEGLLEKAGCELPVLCGSAGDALLSRWSVPRWVPTESSVVKKGRSFILTASGGVQIDSWRYASQSEVSQDLREVRQPITLGDSWRWN